MELLGLFTLLGAGGVALLATPLCRRLALRLAFIDQPGERKIHRTPVPYGGGVATFGATLLVLLTCYYLLLSQDPLQSIDRGLFDFVLSQSLPSMDPVLVRDVGLCLAGAGGALVLGLIDDRRALPAGTKLLGQGLLAAAVVAGGVRLTVLIGDNIFTQCLTAGWIVLLTNSFNLLDNMDGLCSGCAAISAGILGWIALRAQELPVALALFALCGACLGFLYWNRAPARIFLGDAGSMSLGFLLGSLSVVTTYYNYEASVLSVGVPLLVFAIPLYDTASVIWIRVVAGRSIFKGDTNHFSHRLVDLGMSRQTAVQTIHLAALAIALPAIVIAQLDLAFGLLLVAQAVLILALIALLERLGRRKRSDVAAGTNPPR